MNGQQTKGFFWVFCLFVCLFVFQQGWVGLHFHLFFCCCCREKVAWPWWVWPPAVALTLCCTISLSSINHQLCHVYQICIAQFQCHLHQQERQIGITLHFCLQYVAVVLLLFLSPWLEKHKWNVIENCVSVECMFTYVCKCPRQSCSRGFFMSKVMFQGQDSSEVKLGRKFKTL